MITALVHRYGDFDTAEDATQEALLAAATQWAAQGDPVDPKAWLVRVASRKLVDRWRADGARVTREERVFRRVGPPAGPASARDETLPLLLLCCHPALPPASQVALTLRVLSGLSTAQIARVFLVPEATMAQRISRAKGTLRAAEIRLSAVSAAELPGRVRSVLQVIYLLFTEGHTATVGDRLVDVSTTAEAIRLAGLLRAAVPSDGEAAGLLALLLITDARRAARTGPGGALVPLADQDRTRWDRAQIDRGVALIEQTLPHDPVGPYQLQAAIAAVHAEAIDADRTDWEQIEVLYTMLMQLDPGPVVALNHAVALAHVHGPVVALERIEPLRTDPGLRRQHRLPAVRAHLLELAGRTAEARSEFERAAALTTSRPEQRYLLARAAAVRAGPSRPGDDQGWTLLGPDGRPYASPEPGTLGGHRGSKIYGRLDCPAAIRAIKAGGYTQHRVFFADENAARAAGYRPCGTCLAGEHRDWKASRSTSMTASAGQRGRTLASDPRVTSTSPGTPRTSAVGDP